MTLLRFLAACAAVAALSSGQLLAAPMYNFVEIARGDGAGASPFSQFQTGMGLNEFGRVVFRANLDTTALEALVTGDGGATITIVTEGDFGHAALHSPTISDAGSVMFRAGPNTSEQAVLAGAGGAFTTYATIPASPFIGPNWFDQVLNADGGAVISGGVTAGTQLYLADGVSAPALLYDAALIADIDLFFSIDINEGGTVASIVGPGFGQPVELVVGDGGALTKIVDDGDGLGNLGHVTVNNSGFVAFSAEGGAFGPESLYVSNFAASHNLIADLSDAFSLFNNFGMSLNDLGEVAFWAELDAGGSGIFLGPDAVNDKVIAVGDSLFGFTVTSLHFERFNLNNSGQLAFSATLSNGDQVIVRADPISEVPEPSSLVLVVAGLAGVAVPLLRRRRRQR